MGEVVKETDAEDSAKPIIQNIFTFFFHFFQKYLVNICVCPPCLPAYIHQCDPLISQSLSRDVGVQMLS